MIDRKEAIRAFKERPQSAGIFAVRHLASGRVFVGSGANISSLLKRQEGQLKMRLHPNPALQQAWDADGEAAFAFEVLDVGRKNEGETASASEIRELERLWLEELQPYDESGFNRRPRAL